ncbi:HlyD family secretion protein [Roseiconus nitratireducens]|uniref:HlyD family secretion protein n=1 Tax=Roseiconus nitratireducens TaxID=2605748 RepID=A0A5M6D7N0_9BACT|nr:HlyD family secretion protein [Roseiconus nitratireducens]KAA5541869.1 HlyD family secretion protein [Roseiconus nitratireducens]
MELSHVRPPHCLRPAGRLLFAWLLLVIAAPAIAEDPSPNTEAKSVKVDGVFQSTRQSEVAAANEHLTELKIERVLPHGTEVKQGQAVIWFETEPLDKSLKKAEHERRLAELALEADEFDHTQFLEQLKLDKQAAERKRDAAQQAYDNYQKVDREQQIEQAKFSLKNAEFSLESAKEEYEQLTQMYEEDDLTEQSEEIVLRRAKRAVEAAEFSLQRTSIQTDRTIKQTIPRNDADQEETLARALMEFKKSNQDLDNARRKRELEIKRKRTELEEQSEKVEEMRAERKAVVLKADMDGIFLHGALTRGVLPAKPVNLKEGTSASPNQVLATIVGPGKIQVRIDLPEQHLAVARQAKTCQVVPKGLPDTTLTGKVQSVAEVPFLPGKFDCLVSLQGQTPDHINPTMGCEVTFPGTEEESAEEKDADNQDGGDPKDDSSTSEESPSEESNDDPSNDRDDS